MSGRTNWKDIKHKGDPARVAEQKRAIERDLTLAELRKARELTQSQLAKTLGMTQSGISQMENRADVYVSTLRSYIQALGGQLEIVAVFPDSTVTLRDLAEIAEDEALAGAR